MQIEITGRHIEITEPIRLYVEKRLKKFGRLFVEPIDIHVILAVEKHRQSAEIVLKSKLCNLTSLEETTDMYNSISRAIEKMSRQALRQKEKVISTKRQTSMADFAISTPPSAPAPNTKKRGNNSNSRSHIILEEMPRKKPMGVEEALIDLSESEKNFVVFRDSESDGVHVLYRRKDGNLGLIRPD
jgi:putative sigma-54 modulation protein